MSRGADDQTESDGTRGRDDRMTGVGYLAVLVQAAVVSYLPVYVGQLLSEVLDLDEFGRFYSFLSVVSLAVLFAGIGLDKVATMVVTAANRTGDLTAARGLRAKAPWLIGGATIAVWSVLLTSHAASQDLGPNELVEYGFVLALIPIIAFGKYQYGATIPHGRPVLASFFRDVMVLLVVIVLVLGLALAGYTDLGVPHAATVYALGYLSASLSLGTLRRRIEPGAFRRGDRRHEFGTWIRTGLASSTGLMVYMLIATSALLYAQWFLGDDELSGRIASINQIGAIPLPLGLGFARVITPAMMRAIDAGDRRGVLAISKRFLMLTTPPVLVVTGLTIVFMKPILYWYGPEYVSAATAAIILVLGTTSSSLLTFGTTISNLGPGLSRRNLVAVLITIVGVASFGLVRTDDLAGLAIVQVSTMFVCSVVLSVLGYRRLASPR